MPFPNRQLSFAAGSSSLDPYGYRTLGPESGARIAQLAQVFPSLRRFLNSSALIINAYPAALGLGGLAPLVDTYLHPPTFIRSMRLATNELRPVIMVAQPLAGADLLVRLCEYEGELPRQMLWAAGGYFFPASLERFAIDLLRERGCRLTILHAYGVAEIGHSCFAAIERFPTGLPKFLKVATEINRIPASGSSALILENNGRCIDTGDRAQLVDGHWRIESGAGRMDPSVRETLETWTGDQWRRRTGYLNATTAGITIQVRENASQIGSPSEIGFHKFWHLHGGSMATKPRWEMYDSKAETSRNSRTPGKDSAAAGRMLTPAIDV
jgi:hypothetical protein